MQGRLVIFVRSIAGVFVLIVILDGREMRSIGVYAELSECRREVSVRHTTQHLLRTQVCM
jgi:hypothetical protein